MKTKPKKFRYRISVFWNTLKKNSYQAIIAALFILAGFAFFIFRPIEFGLGISTKWGHWLEPYMALATFVFALFIWYNEKRQDWQMSLPKKLTIHFIFNDKYIMTCHEAYLAHEGDIRNFGQQIGKQMNNNKNLSMYPYMKQETKRLSECGSYYIYEATIYLSKNPADEKDGNNQLNNKYLVWLPTEFGKPITEYYHNIQTTKPLTVEEANILLSQSDNQVEVNQE